MVEYLMKLFCRIFFSEEKTIFFFILRKYKLHIEVYEYKGTRVPQNPEGF